MKTIRNLRGTFAAFTLIELLVVISIIAVLAALALPAVTGALTKGQITQTTSNYRQLYVLTQAASLDSQTAGGVGAFPGEVGGTGTAWSNALVPTYCTAQTFANLYNVKGSNANTLWWNVTSSSESSAVFLTVKGVSATSNSISYDGTGPYQSKGGAVVTVGGSAISFVGTNSPVMTNGTVTGGTNTSGSTL